MRGGYLNSVINALLSDNDKGNRFSSVIYVVFISCIVLFTLTERRKACFFRDFNSGIGGFALGLSVT